MLVDEHSRRFHYLRLSLTEKCNFRCGYCLPNGNTSLSKATEFLKLHEIQNIASAFKQLGVRKIRLTGGEPTLRPDLCEIIHLLKDQVGIEEVALTTNGYRLDHLASELRLVGLDTINISIDSLSENGFRNITGTNLGNRVKESVDLCLSLGIKKVKVNCVMLRNLNDHEFSDFVDFAKNRPISVRFIELMRTGDNQKYFEEHHISVMKFADQIQSAGWISGERTLTSGPAIEFRSKDSRGTLGFISAYRKNFCSGCNRLRVSARGRLRLCLFGDGDLNLRDLCQNESSKRELQERVLQALGAKAATHQLAVGVYGDMQSLSAIGG